MVTDGRYRSQESVGGNSLSRAPASAAGSIRTLCPAPDFPARHFLIERAWPSPVVVLAVLGGDVSGRLPQAVLSCRNFASSPAVQPEGRSSVKPLQEEGMSEVA